METNQFTVEKYYDISQLETISRGNVDFIKKMLTLFIEQAPALLAELKNNYDSRELLSMGEVAHKIKPIVDNMGILSIKAAIREVEKIGKSNAISHLLPDLIIQVDFALNRAILEIRKDYEL